MVHVLRQIHKSLRPHGVLLDLHPLPRVPWIEIWRDGNHRALGELEDPIGIQEVRAARARLERVMREGLFRVDARRWFDWKVHYATIDEWSQRREERGATSVIPPALLAEVQREMQEPGSTLVVVERTRVTTMRKS